MIRVGVAGTGIIVREVLPLLRGWGFEPAALCGTPRSKDEVEELCKEHKILKGFCDYEEMVAYEGIDCVYVAVPNFLHDSFVQKALEQGKNVIVEKPMTSNVHEAQMLSGLAREKNLFLFEAISTVYLPNYKKIQQWLPLIGTVKIVSCNFSNYSRRYDAFRSGTVLPAFDPAKSGGALMDLNLYNLHYILGLFGEPKSARYMPNIERGIDTSGVLFMDYGSFQAVSIAAKDCSAPWSYCIQGTDGYILQKSPANFCLEVTLHRNDGTEETFDEEPESRLEPEFLTFAQEMEAGDTRFCYEMLDHSLAVSKVQTQVRLDAGIVFPADEA